MMLCLRSMGALMFILPMDNRIGVSDVRCATSKTGRFNTQRVFYIARFTVEILVAVWHTQRLSSRMGEGNGSVVNP